MQDKPFYISGRSFWTITSSFYTAIDNKDEEILSLLNSFLYKQLSDSYDSDSEKAFEGFSSMLPYQYEYALNKLNTSITYKEIYEICADRSVRSIKEKLGYGFRSEFMDNSLTIENKLQLNKYAKILLNRFSEIINVCLRGKDLQKLPFILGQLHQISGSYNYKLTELKFEIQQKRQQKLEGAELKELFELERIYAADSFTDNTVRLIFKVTLFWSFFLYNIEILTFDELQSVLQVYESYRNYIESDFVEDLLKLRVFRSENEFSWGRWDYKDRSEDGVYTPPNVQFWVTLGAILYILKSKQDISFQLENKTAEEINAHEYLLTSMEEILKSLRKTGFNKYKNVINSQSQEGFESSIDSLQQRLMDLKSSTITLKEEQISQIPLDAEYVDNFKKIMCDAWDKANALREIFAYFNSIISVPEDTTETEFYRIGIKNELWMGYKTSLIRSEDFHISVFGIEHNGQNLIKTEENTFFGSLLSKKRIPIENALSGIDSAIESLKKTFHPSIIMMGLDVWYTYFRDFKSENFIFDWNDKQGYDFTDFGGIYKEIPIVKFRGDILRNVIVVADFRESFELKQKLKTDAFKDILVNGITEITDADAEAIIEENPDYWKQGLSHEKAKMKIMNSIKVDFYILEKFIVKNEEAYSLMTLDK